MLQLSVIDLTQRGRNTVRLNSDLAQLSCYIRAYRSILIRGSTFLTVEPLNKQKEAVISRHFQTTYSGHFGITDDSSNMLSPIVFGLLCL